VDGGTVERDRAGLDAFPDFAVEVLNVRDLGEPEAMGVPE
jgi:hypothetical protein